MGSPRPSGAGASQEIAIHFTAATRQLESGMGRVQKSFGDTEKVIGGFIGAVVFSRMIREISLLASEAVKFKRIAAGFEALTVQFDLSGRRVVANIQEVTRGQIATVQIMESVNKALTLLPPAAERMLELATIATGAAAALGLDVRRAFDDITTGIGRASPKILDNLGIIVNAREAYRAYGLEIDKLPGSLGAVDKQIALLNQVIDRNIDRFGTIARAVEADPFQQLGAAVMDLKIEFGKLLATNIVPFLRLLGKFIDSKKDIELLAEEMANMGKVLISLGLALVVTRSVVALSIAFKSLSANLITTTLVTRGAVAATAELAGITWIARKAAQALVVTRNISMAQAGTIIATEQRYNTIRKQGILINQSYSRVMRGATVITKAFNFQLLLMIGKFAILAGAIWFIIDAYTKWNKLISDGARIIKEGTKATGIFAKRIKELEKAFKGLDVGIISLKDFREQLDDIKDSLREEVDIFAESNNKMIEGSEELAHKLTDINILIGVGTPESVNKAKRAFQELQVVIAEINLERQVSNWVPQLVSVFGTMVDVIAEAGQGLLEFNQILNNIPRTVGIEGVLGFGLGARLGEEEARQLEQIKLLLIDINKEVDEQKDAWEDILDTVQTIGVALKKTLSGMQDDFRRLEVLEQFGIITELGRLEGELDSIEKALEDATDDYIRLTDTISDTEHWIALGGLMGVFATQVEEMTDSLEGQIIVRDALIVSMRDHVQEMVNTERAIEVLKASEETLNDILKEKLGLMDDLLEVFTDYNQALRATDLLSLSGVIDTTEVFDDTIKNLEGSVEDLANLMSDPVFLMLSDIVRQDTLDNYNQLAAELRHVNSELEITRNSLEALSSFGFDAALEIWPALSDIKLPAILTDTLIPISSLEEIHSLILQIQKSFGDLSDTEFAQLGVDLALEQLEYYKDIKTELLTYQSLWEANLLLAEEAGDVIKEGIAAANLEEILEDLERINPELFAAAQAWITAAGAMKDAVKAVEDAEFAKILEIEEAVEALKDALEVQAIQFGVEFEKGIQSGIQLLTDAFIGGDIRQAVIGLFTTASNMIQQAITQAAAAQVLSQGLKGAAAAKVTGGAATTAGWVGLGFSVLTSVLSSLTKSSQQMVTQLSQPLKVIVTNPITIKTPARTRALLGSGGTVFSSSMRILIARGGMPIP